MDEEIRENLPSNQMSHRLSGNRNRLLNREHDNITFNTLNFGKDGELIPQESSKDSHIVFMVDKIPPTIIDTLPSTVEPSV